MNEKPKIAAAPKTVGHVYHHDFDQTNDSAKPNDIWNDPDLVPPPVVILDQEDYGYGDEHDY
jgi:hypothetical protein